MKKLFYSSIIILLFQSCAIYNVSIMDKGGEVIKEHETRKVYTGTQSFVLDAIVSPFVMVYSLFVPLPSVKSSIGVGGGITLGSYIKSYYSLSPVDIGGSKNSNWVIFDANDGKEYSYSGYNYTINKNTKFDNMGPLEWGGKFKKQ